MILYDFFIMTFCNVAFKMYHLWWEIPGIFGKEFKIRRKQHCVCFAVYFYSGLTCCNRLLPGGGAEVQRAAKDAQQPGGGGLGWQQRCVSLLAPNRRLILVLFSGFCTFTAWCFSDGIPWRRTSCSLDPRLSPMSSTNGGLAPDLPLQSFLTTFSGRFLLRRDAVESPEDNLLLYQPHKLS